MLISNTDIVSKYFGHYLYKSTKSKVAADTLNSVIPNEVIWAQKPRPPAVAESVTTGNQ